MTMFRRVTRSQRGFTSGIVETSCLPSSTHLWFFCYHAFLFRMKWKRLHGLTSVHWCHHSFLWDVHCLPGTACHSILSGLGCSCFSSSWRWSGRAPFHARMCFWKSAYNDCYLGLLTAWFGPQLMVSLIIREQSEFLSWYWEGGSASWLVQLSVGPLPNPEKLAPTITWNFCGGQGLVLTLYSKSSGKVIGGF